MSAVVKEAISRLLATICMMWLFDTKDKPAEAYWGNWMAFYVYPNDLKIADERMKGKRIKIEFQIEDKPPKS
jgi:hypothetical protein